MLTLAESGTPSLPIHESVIQRNAQKQRWRKTVDTLLCRRETVETVFRTVISVNQLSIHGAVSDVCEIYDRGTDPALGELVDQLMDRLLDDDTTEIADDVRATILRLHHLWCGTARESLCSFWCTLNILGELAEADRVLAASVSRCGSRLSVCWRCW